MLDQKSLTTLEFIKIREIVAGYTGFSGGRELALAMQPTIELEQAREWQAETREAMSLFNSDSGVTIGGARDVRRAADNGGLHLDDRNISINGLDLKLLTEHLDAKKMADLGNALDATLVLSSLWPFVVLAFVVFFYCLGALYDDRRDRSILFWKSLPVSDLATVLSKLATALLMAPLLAILASVLTLAGYLALMMAGVAWAGADPITLVWQPARPLALLGNLLLSLPAYALWALPTAGWLLLCSAFARRVPFLWAVVVPVLGGALLSASGLVGMTGLGHAALWRDGIARLLLGTMPGMTELYLPDAAGQDQTALTNLFSASHAFAPLSLPALWIGAVFGLACVAGAVWLRRRSDDS